HGVGRGGCAETARRAGERISDLSGASARTDRRKKGPVNLPRIPASSLPDCEEKQVSKIEVRKSVLIVEDTEMEMGRPVDPPLRKVAAIAVVKNPFAGRYVEDLSLLVDFGETLGDQLTRRAMEALSAPSGQ